ncbi:hypothetical protein MMC11_006578 [Xylographa trunciseda]|nr:hypothetical protein [Xylographa trunciseda]
MHEARANKPINHESGAQAALSTFLFFLILGSFLVHPRLPLSAMSSHDVLCPAPVRDLKRTLADLDSDSKPAGKRTRLSPYSLPTPPYSTQNEHPKQSSPLCDPPDWRQRLKSSLLRPLDNQYRPPTKQPPANSQLSAWLNAVPYPRSDSCPTIPRTYSLPSCLSELERPQSCPAQFDLVRPERPASGPFAVDFIEPKHKHARLTLTALQEMSKQQPQNAESVGPPSNSSSSNKPPGTSDAAYMDTLFGHGIIMDPSGRKIPKELEPLKERILQRRSSPQLDNEAVFEVMNTAEELAYSSEGPTNKILRTPMFPLWYGGLAEGGNTQWNTIALPNNPKCDNKLSAPKPDAYLAYQRGQKSPWTVEQNNVVNHYRVRPYSQPAKRNTFPSISIELKSESAGGVLTTAEAQAAGSGSHSVNAVLWLLEKAKAAGLTEVDMVEDTVSFSIVASHRQVVAYLHWLDPKAKHIYMSYLRSYSTFEVDAIRGCNNTIKNMIDNANGPRQMIIGKALVTLEPVIDSWNPPPAGTNPPTPNPSVFGEPRPRKRGRGSQVQ